MGKGWGVISAAPLVKRIAGKGQAAAFAAKLNVSDQVVTNWKRRKSIPARELPRIALALGMSVETYLREAGAPTGVAEPQEQYMLERDQLLTDFDALPTWLQTHIVRKTAELRAYAEALPSFVREGMRAPPKDPIAYAAWEQNIVSDMAARKSKAPAAPSTERRFQLQQTPTAKVRHTDRKRKIPR